MEWMFDPTSICPYTERCESYRTILSSERWMQVELRSMRRQGMDGHSPAGGGYSIETLELKLERLRKVRERCYKYKGRCLRYWQFEKKRKEQESMKKLETRVDLIGVPTITAHTGSYYPEGRVALTSDNK